MMVTGILTCPRDKKLDPGPCLIDFEHSDPANWKAMFFLVDY